ncbi:hypothetical protein V6R21_06360 [Limibacter armeniacum]|uniref:hypothetical protein n=1 Tax=Limibacter armeniacum TaxID=466084 RepID=UPI002FE54575
MKTGIELIAEERNRQIGKEGYSAEHDDQHRKGELSIAAFCYCLPPKHRPYISPISWFKTMKWDIKHWKPTERIKELQKAGALIAAEIDRLNRLDNE